MITLDNNWSVEADDYSWKLVKTYEKEIDEKYRDKATNKLVKTGKKVVKEFEASWWFPKISQCIKKYQEESLKELPTLEAMQEKLISIEELLKNVKHDTFKRC